jgi:hypothetical protein
MVVSLCHCNFNVISIYKVLPFTPGDTTKSKNMLTFVICFFISENMVNFVMLKDLLYLIIFFCSCPK